MIPTMIGFGLVFGRWWKSALVAAAIIWPLLLLAYGAFENPPESRFRVLAIAVALAVVNAGVGVAVHQAILHLVRRMRPRGSGAEQPTGTAR